jgi:hypothetical protein
VVTEKFVSLAKASAKSYGYPDLPLLIVPHPFETLDRAVLERIAEEKVEECIALVTHSLHH